MADWHIGESVSARMPGRARSRACRTCWLRRALTLPCCGSEHSGAACAGLSPLDLDRQIGLSRPARQLPDTNLIHQVFRNIVLFVAPSAYPLGGVVTWLDYLLASLAYCAWRLVLGLTSIVSMT